MNTTSTDRIQKEVDLKAPPTRVWQALTDYREFNQWFRVDLQQPFAVGKVTSGHITYPGYEHMTMDVHVKAMEPERRFAFEWQGDEQTPDIMTFVEFTLTPTEDGTHLTVTETGFDRLPPGRREEKWRENDGGWAEQMQNIKAHVGG